MAKMTDDALQSILSTELSQATGWADANIRQEQLTNLSYYLGYPMGTETPGRSSVVSQDVFEIIESALPGFLEPFFSSDRIGEFKPRTPEDDAFCEQATDFVNYVIKDRNGGFMLMNTWFKDALLSKVGIVRADWEEGEKERRQWFGLTDDQMALLQQDPRIELIEHSTRPIPGMPEANAAQIVMMGGQVPMLHDVTVLEKQAGCVEIENVRPENFIVSRGAGKLCDSKIVGEWVTMTRGELKEQGIRQYLDVTSYTDADLTDAMQARRDGGLFANLAQSNADDPSLEEVRLFMGYVKADYDGDGEAEWRRVLVGGGDAPILQNEEADGLNYCILTPIPIPHRIIGMAYADPARQIQDIKTALTRQYLDSLYLANRPRLYVNTDAQVSIDDLVSDRIGGFVRGRGPAANALAPIQTALVSRDALEGLQMADGMREQRLGIPKINPGVEADALHKTATGTRSVNALVDKRQKMTLRVFAETGIKDLFRLVLRLSVKYQDQESMIRLRGEWVKVDPRQWSPDLDCVVSVGVGTSDETETMMMLQQFAQYMQWAGTMGIVSPQNVYEYGKLLAKNARLMSADKLLSDPAKMPPKPPQMPPEAIKAQAQMQVEQMKASTAQQTDAARMQHEQALEQSRMAMQTQVDTHRQQVEAEQKALEAAASRELEQFKAQLQMQTEAQKLEFERWKAQLQAETQITLEQMKQGGGPEAVAQAGEMQQVVATAMEGLRVAIERMREPRQIVRDANGRAQGVI